MKRIAAVHLQTTAATGGPRCGAGPTPAPAGWASIARELRQLGYSAGAIGKAFLVLQTGGSSRDARAALEGYVEPPGELADALAPDPSTRQTLQGRPPA